VLCGPAFSQVAAERQARRDAFLATSSKRCRQARLSYAPPRGPQDSQRAAPPRVSMKESPPPGDGTRLPPRNESLSTPLGVLQVCPTCSPDRCSRRCGSIRTARPSRSDRVRSRVWSGSRLRDKDPVWAGHRAGRQPACLDTGVQSLREPPHGDAGRSRGARRPRPTGRLAAGPQRRVQRWMTTGGE
jgi:hypothetical protein